MNGKETTVVNLLLASCGLVPGCASGEVKQVPVAEMNLRLDGAKAAFGDSQWEKAAELAEKIIECPAHPDVTPEALFLAGRARLHHEQRRKAFEHYRTLLHDYPLSARVPEIEREIFEIGQWYLNREPSFLFGHLFTGRSRGVEVLREFQAAYPQSERADDALILMGDFRFGEKEYDLAALHYGDLAKNYSKSEWADLSSYRLARSYRLSSRGVGYARTPLVKAAEAYRKYLQRPDFEQFQAPAREDLAEVEEWLAQHELRIANFYLLRGNDRGARSHYANAVLAYPGTASSKEAEKQLQQHGWDASVHSLDQLIDEGILPRGRQP